MPVAALVAQLRQVSRPDMRANKLGASIGELRCVSVYPRTCFATSNRLDHSQGAAAVVQILAKAFARRRGKTLIGHNRLLGLSKHGGHEVERPFAAVSEPNNGCTLRSLAWAATDGNRPHVTCS